MQPSERNRQLNKDRYDSLSISGNVMKKNQSRGPRHGQSMRQVMYHKARDMLRKAKLPKNGSCETILERCHTDADNQSRSLMKDGQKRKLKNTRWPWKTIPMKQHLQKGDDGQKNWKIVSTKERVEGKIRQQPDFREAKHAHRQLDKEYVESTGP